MNNIKQIIEDGIDRFAVDFTQFPWENESSYKAYLSQSYYYVTHSVKLLKYALDVCDKNRSELRSRLTEHIQEESGHEVMALKDLKKLGESPEMYGLKGVTESMYEYVYSKIDEYGPVSIFAYAMALEGVSKVAAPGVAERLIVTYGKESSQFLYHHGVLDQDHVEEGMGVLKEFTTQELEAFEEVFLKSIENYTLLLKEVSELKLAA